MSAVLDFVKEYIQLNPGEPIKLHPYQENVLDCDARFRIILKARQVGISSIIAWEALAYALLHDNQTILLISTAERQATELLGYVKRALINLRLTENIKTLEESKTVLHFDNGSRIISLPNSPNTVQGFRAHRIYIDEFGIFEGDRKMLDAILPSISHGGTLTLISRAHGQRGEFYRIWKEAKEGKNEFAIFTIPYTECKNKKYQEMIERIKKVMDMISFREQYICEFIDETQSYFPYDLLIPCIDDNLTQPREGQDLRIGIDFGKKINSTVITVIEFKNGIYLVRKLKEFLGVRYGTQLNHINRLIEDLKPNVVYVDEFGIGIRLTEELTDKWGSIIAPIGLNQEVKTNMITDLGILFEDKQIKIPRNEKLIAQLHALQRKTSGGGIRWEPGKTEKFGKHDDYVWSLALALSKEETAPIPLYFESGDLPLREQKMRFMFTPEKEEEL